MSAVLTSVILLDQGEKKNFVNENMMQVCCNISVSLLSSSPIHTIALFYPFF